MPSPRTSRAKHAARTLPPTRPLRGVYELFCHRGRPDWALIGLAAIINLLVIVNAVWHHPKIGYDVVENITYIQVLLHRLPTEQDSAEYFSPPLPYVLPALFDRVCMQFDARPLQKFDTFMISWTCRTVDGKFAQALNVLLSIGTTVLLLALSQQVRPDSRFFKLASLALLANLTAYYKTFSQVRAEPYVVFFAVLSLCLAGGMLRSRSLAWRRVLLLGITLGALILSRQWGFFLLPALGLMAIIVLMHDRQRGWLLMRQYIVSGAIGLLVGGFFYLSLFTRYGSPTAFNIERPIYPSLQQTYQILRRTHLGDLSLFQDPIRHAFRGSFMPILHSELWGDYWGYFTYIKPNSSYGENGYTTSPGFISYLGRVNLVAMPVALFLVAGAAFSCVVAVRSAWKLDARNEFLVLVCLAAVTLWLGFGWFVYSYVLQSEGVIKATYALQAFVVLILPTAAVVERIGGRSQKGQLAVMVVLGAVFLHNLPAMITQYNVFWFW